MTDDSIIINPDAPVESVAEEEKTTKSATAIAQENHPGEKILKNLKILPPLQKDGTLPKNHDELLDAVSLPPIRAEEPVSSIRAALGDVCGYAHITNFRLVLEDTCIPRSPHRHNDAATTPLPILASGASTYTGVNAVISIPVALKSLDEDEDLLSSCSNEKNEQVSKVLDEFGDLTPFLSCGLQDGSAFRIVLERYNAASIKDHVARLRTLLEGNAPHAETLDENSGDRETGAEGENIPSEDLSKADEGNEGTNGNDKDNEDKDISKEDKSQKDPIEAAKGMPVFADGKPLTPDVKDLKHFFYYACGEDPELFLGDADNVGSNKRDNGFKAKKKSKKKNSSKTNSIGCAADNEAEEALQEERSIKEIIPQLNELEEKTRISCFIKFSGFHPPPQFRRLMGDLAYLQALFPDNEVAHITATAMGFYINRSSTEDGKNVFDPSPSNKPCFSHELLDCMLKHSTSFDESWSQAVTASKTRAELMAHINKDGPFFSFFRVAIRGDFPGYQKPSVASAAEGIDSLVQTPSWLVSLPNVEYQCPDSWNRNCEHSYNEATTEDDLSSTYGVDIRSGPLRDWNEELQVAREMPVDSLQERIERARVLNKVLSDFGEAALLGVRAICEGSVSSMNPNEPSRSQVYLHNNIFFSRAVDAGIETFKVAKGDRAAKKSASRDLQCLGTLHRMEKTGLHTLATVLIDYLGSRYVCQSILPGILNGEKTHTLLYGAVEAGTPLASDAEMHDLFENSLGKSLMIATRRIAREPLTLEKAAEVEAIKKMSPLYLKSPKQQEAKKLEPTDPIMEICSPIEAKGIRGSDTRKYVLDMTRITPRDANWVSQEKGGTGNWEAIIQSKDTFTNNRIPQSVEDDEWTLAVLRSELVRGYQQMLLQKFLRGKENAKESKEEKNGKEENKVEEQKRSLSDEDLDYVKSLRINVNVFLPDIRSLEGIDNEAFAQLKKDEEMVRDIASHLWETIIPGITTDIREGSLNSIPHDGKSLTEFIHQKGINCRYLGRLASLAMEEEEKDRIQFEENTKTKVALTRRKMPQFWLELLETEMVARAAKHVLDRYLCANGASVASMPAQTVASFLSALLSDSEETASQTETRLTRRIACAPEEEDLNALTFYGLVGDGDAMPCPVRGRHDIWRDIEEEIGRRFRYNLTLYNRPGKKSRAMYVPLLRRVCQRTGIRLVAKSYDIGGKCYCSDGASGGKIISSFPISALDVVDIVPLMKHSAAHGEGFVPCGVAPSGGLPPLHISLVDARAALEAAHVHHNQKQLSQALDLAQEAAGLYQRVTESPAHPGVVRCIDLMGSILYDAGEPGLAAANACRALGFQVQISGFDSSDAINLHLTIFQFHLAAGDVAESVKHMRAALYLMELIGGRHHVELSNAFHKAGTVYHGVNDLETALRFYQEATSRELHDRLLEGMICKSTALVMASLGNFKGAVEKEKVAFNLFSVLLGENHKLTKQSEQQLKSFLGAAARHGKGIVDNLRLQKEEEAALAIANEIEAEEAAEEEKRKKKNLKKKKGKK